MRALLAFGAKVNPVNAFRQTPLDIALTLRYEGTEMVSQLVSLGALVSDREQVRVYVRTYQYVCMSTCTYVHVCVCTCTYMYVHMHVHTCLSITVTIIMFVFM